MNVALLGLLAAGAVALVMVLDRVIRQPWLGVAAAGLTAAGYALASGYPTVSVGPVGVTFADVAVLMLLGAVTAWLLRGTRLRGDQRVLVVLMALIAFSIARGSREFGFALSVNEARDAVYFVSGALFGSFLDPSRRARARLARFWFALCGALIVIAAARWGIVASGTPLRGQWFTPEYGGLRVLWAHSALVLAQGLLIGLGLLLRGGLRGGRRWLLLGLLAVVATLQHRSVWIGTLVSGTWLVWHLRNRLDRRLLVGGTAAALVIGAVSLAAVDAPDVFQQVTQAQAVNTDTFEWRLAGWTALIEHSGPQTAAEVVIGRPYGAGWRRELARGFVVDVPPHNQYVELALRVGLVGLGLVLLLALSAARGMGAGGAVRDGPLDDAVLRALLLSQALYAIPYNLTMEQGLLFGFMLAAAARARRRLPGGDIGWGGPDTDRGPAVAIPVEAVRQP